MKGGIMLYWVMAVPEGYVNGCKKERTHTRITSYNLLDAISR
jgi:hypothetical protein